MTFFSCKNVNGTIFCKATKGWRWQVVHLFLHLLIPKIMVLCRLIWPLENIAFETERICIVKNEAYWLDEQTKLRTNIVVNHTMNIIYSFWHENSKSHGCTVDHKNASSFDFCVTVCWDCGLGGGGGQFSYSQKA